MPKYSVRVLGDSEPITAGFHRSRRSEGEPFEAFPWLIGPGGFRGFFPETPFGDEGIEAPMLAEALSRPHLHFNLRGRPAIEEEVDCCHKAKPLAKGETAVQIEAQRGVGLLAVTWRLQFRKFTPVSVRSDLCAPVHEPSRPHFVHSREPA